MVGWSPSSQLCLQTKQRRRKPEPPPSQSISASLQEIFQLGSIHLFFPPPSSIFRTSHIASDESSTQRSSILSRFYLHSRRLGSEKMGAARCEYRLESPPVSRDGRRSCISTARVQQQRRDWASAKIQVMDTKIVSTARSAKRAGKHGLVSKACREALG